MLLLFFRVQDLVDEKFKVILVVCYENVQGHAYYTYSTFILEEIIFRERFELSKSMDCHKLFIT